MLCFVLSKFNIFSERSSPLESGYFVSDNALDGKKRPKGHDALQLD